MNLYGKIIIIKRNETDGAHFPLTVNCCLFGRSMDCDIRIQLPSVDVSQCQIEIDDKGHVFIKDLSKLAPTLLNNKALPTSLTALSHGDVITIVDRQFRFEYPPGSRFYPAKSPKAKSPKTQPGGKAVSKMSPRPTPVTPLSPRTDNVPSSSQSGKLSKSPKSMKKETNVNNSRVSGDMAVPPNLFVSPAKTEMKVSSSPDSAVKRKMPAKPPAGSPYPKTGSSLRKSITDLRRRSMPVFETDEVASPSVITCDSQKKNTPVTQKRKSSGFNIPSAKRKRVSFGPSLSPEHFDKNLPPKTPVKKGATPSVKETSAGKSLVKGKLTPKGKSPSPVKKASPGRPRASLSPKKTTPGKPKSSSSAQKITPAKERSTSPAKKATPAKSRSPSPAKKATPSKARSPSPAKSRSPSPAKKSTPSKSRSPSPAKKATPAKVRSPSPAKSTPAKSRSPSPAKKATPAKVRSPSPAKARSPSPVKKATPAKEKKTTPAKMISSPSEKATPGRPKSPFSAKKVSTVESAIVATPVKAMNPSAKKATPGRPKSPISSSSKASPVQVRSPSPAKKATPGRPKSPFSAKKGSTVESEIPSAKKATPGRPKSPIPSSAQATPAKARSPSPAKKATLGRHKSPFSAKKVSTVELEIPSAKKATPGRPKSPIPSSAQATPAKARSPSPAKKATPGRPKSPSAKASPAKKNSPGRPKSLSPSSAQATPAKARSPSPAKKATPVRPKSPFSAKKVPIVESESPSPAMMATHVTAKNPSAKKATPGRPKSMSPSSVKATSAAPMSPSPAKKNTPGRPKSPATIKKTTPVKSTTPVAPVRNSSVKKGSSRKSAIMSPESDLFSQLTPLLPQQSTSGSFIAETPKSRGKFSGKRSLTTLKNGPQLDATLSPSGLKRLMKTPSPDLVLSPIGIKRIMKTPAGVRRLMKTPEADITVSPTAIQRLMKTPVVANKHSDDTPTGQQYLGKTPGKSANMKNTSKVIKTVQINAQSPLGFKRLAKTPVVKRAGHDTKSPTPIKNLMKSPKGKSAIASNLDVKVTPKDKRTVLKTPTSQSVTSARPQSLKSGRTPKVKMIFDSSPIQKVSSPKTGRKSLGESSSKSKKDLKEKIAMYASPGEKIIAPPQDINKVVALRAIHGITPKLAILQKAAGMTPKSGKRDCFKTPKSGKKGQTPKSGKKGQTPRSSKKTVKTWADVVKGGAPARPLAKSVKTLVRKKTPKKTVRKPRQDYIQPVPSTSQFNSPATVFIGKKTLGATRLKTPKPLPRKGRKKSMSKVRKSLGNVSLSGMPEMFATPEQSTSPQLSESALYAEIPDTPSGPNEMMVSPLSGRSSKSAGSRESVNLTGVKELFSKDKIHSKVSMIGVRELYQQRKSPAEMRLKGVRELLKTPKPAQGASPSGMKELFATPKSDVPFASSSKNSSRKLSPAQVKTPKSEGKGVRGRKRKMDEAADMPSPNKKIAVEIVASPSPVKPRTTRRGAAKQSPVKKLTPVKKAGKTKVLKSTENTSSSIVEKSPSPVKPRATKRGAAAKKSPVKKTTPVKKGVKAKIEIPAAPSVASVTDVQEVKSPSPMKPRATRRGAAARKSPVKKTTSVKKAAKTNIQIPSDLSVAPVKSPSPVKPRTTRKGASVVETSPSPVKPRATKRGVAAKKSPVKKTPAKKGAKAKIEIPSDPSVALVTDVQEVKSLSPVKPRTTRRGVVVKSPVKKTTPIKKSVKSNVQSSGKDKIASPSATVKKSPVVRRGRSKPASTPSLFSAEPKVAAKATQKKVTPLKSKGRQENKTAATLVQEPSPAKLTTRKGRTNVKLPTKAPTPKVAASRKRKADTDTEVVATESTASPVAKRGRRKLETPVKAASPQVVKKGRAKTKQIVDIPNEQNTATAKKAPKPKTQTVTFVEQDTTQTPRKQSTRGGKKKVEPKLQSPKPVPSRKRKVEQSESTVIKSPDKKGTAVIRTPSPVKPARRAGRSKGKEVVVKSPAAKSVKKDAPKTKNPAKSVNKSVKKDAPKIKSPAKSAPRTRRTRIN